MEFIVRRMELASNRVRRDLGDVGVVDVFVPGLQRGKYLRLLPFGERLA
jgi:hypothetical protein